MEMQKGGETMPPHCDTLDGPVVKEAMRALEEENVDVSNHVDRIVFLHLFRSIWFQGPA
jgi:hypothetical protein